MRKVNELTEGCMAKAADTEMTFVLLSRDPAAPATIRFWCKERIVMGKNSTEDDQINEALHCAQVMAEERRMHLPASLSNIVVLNRDRYDHLVRSESELAIARDMIQRLENHLKSIETSI